MPTSICKMCEGKKQLESWDWKENCKVLKNCYECLGKGEFPMLEQLQDYDWGEAFLYATNPVTVQFTGTEVPLAGFTREDVEELIALDEGQNDVENWIGVFKLKDGRIAFLDAGCDYTGWDCQAWGEAAVTDSLENMIQYGLTNEHRKRLNLYLKETE